MISTFKVFALSSKEKASILFYFILLPVTIRKQFKGICNTRIQSKGKEDGDQDYSRNPRGKLARVPELGLKEAWLWCDREAQG